jgi:hypothetical protein
MRGGCFLRRGWRELDNDRLAVVSAVNGDTSTVYSLLHSTGSPFTQYTIKHHLPHVLAHEAAQYCLLMAEMYFGAYLSPKNISELLVQHYDFVRVDVPFNNDVIEIDLSLEREKACLDVKTIINNPDLSRPSLLMAMRTMIELEYE